VALTGKQKAAMLLLNMDTGTAAELLKDADVEVVEEIALELARIDASGRHNAKDQVKVAQEFCQTLQKKQAQTINIKGFLNEMLVSVVGEHKAEQIRSQIRKVTEKKDMFIAIRSASTDELVLALEGEHPQTIAVVLSELATEKAQEVLSLLDAEARCKAIYKMTNPEVLGAGVKPRVAFMVNKRLESFKGEALTERPQNREQNLRKLAIMLSGLEKDLRDELLDEIGKHDEETALMVRNLMITWEDIPSVADRSLQEALRTVDTAKLARALFGADEEIAQKIRSNISERAAAMLDEESSLMQEPLEKEILDAREEAVKPLRKANEEGVLRRMK
jgi:flagellar motor switch protein FliG